MDYTALSYVKAEGHIAETNDDTLLSRKITQASRAIDMLIAGVPGVVDYCKAETITNEVLASFRNPLIDSSGKLLCWPHKPIVTAVSALAVRFAPNQPWVDFDPTLISIENQVGVMAWGTFPRERAAVRISYTGGFGTFSVGQGGVITSSLPDVLVDLATLLTIRYYKEVQTGLSDSIGINDLGFTQYVKALPVRITEFLTRYTRTTPW